MTAKRAIVSALIGFAAFAALPASAAAQAPIAPPGSDDYLDAYFLNGGDNLVPGDVRAIAVDTTNYTVQDDMSQPAGQPSKGGPKEPRVCEGYNPPSTYGNTVWAAFHTNHYGTMEVSAASGTFDEVIRVLSFRSPENAVPNLPGGCFDDLSGSQESARGLVFPKTWYAVQVGGTINDTSATQGGPMQIKFDLQGPPKVAADSLLFWRTQPLRVTSLTVQGVTKGAKVTLSCTKGACKKTTKTAKKPTWTKPIAAVGFPEARMKNGPAARGSSAPRAFRPIAHAAKTKFTLLKNKKVKKGATITVRVTAPGFIGRHFFWKVKSGSLTNKKVSCMNPGSPKPHKLGTCHG
jgi:hypothetical protein